MSFSSYRRQRPITGKHRVPTLGCLDPALRKWLEREAERYRCFPSFVLNSCVSFVSGIEMEHESYREERKKTKLKLIQGGKKRRKVKVAS